jgi:hypothetical protein
LSRALLLLLALLALGASGCSKEDAGEAPVAGRDEPSADPAVPDGDEEVIRGWNDALSSGDYGAAADYFAPGAVVEQVVELRLRDRSDALEFNRSLPCRSELTGLEPADGATVASFDLSDGPTGDCAEGGTAEVEFVIRDGKIEEWRQLPGAPPPEVDPA